MRHLYNEDYSDIESVSSSMTIKQHESRMYTQDEKDTKSDSKDPNEKGVTSNNIIIEGKEEIDKINAPDDLIQSFSTFSGIALPMPTRFV